MSLVDHLISEIATPPTAVGGGGGGTPTDLNYAASPTGGTVTSSTGTNALLPAATGINAGLFLPAEKTKLSGIAAGAEVNVNADWNAVSGDALILNKPTLGTAAAANTTAFATAAQGLLADSALQPEDIGSSVQGYSSILQNTTASFTSADETKLDGIAVGAEANVNADWNAVSGDAEILNKPTLGTAAAASATDFATAAQGALADTSLQPGDIGVTVHPFGVSTLAYFTESQNASAPNDTTFVHAFSAVDSGATNIDVAIAPKGSGSFALNIADGTATGGNKRGLYSVDLQLGRDSASQVASGLGGFLAGVSNTGAGTFAFGGGGGNTFPGQYSGGWGYLNSFAGQSAGGWGESNEFSGDFSGGWGVSNDFTGQFCGGWGTNNVANAPFCNVFGSSAHSQGRSGTTTLSSGVEATAGDSQLVFGILRNKTTNATPTALTSDSSPTVSASNTIAFDGDGVYGITFNLTAKNPGTSQCGMWLIQVWAVVHLGNLTTPGISIQAIGTPTLPVTIDSSIVAINTTFDSVYLSVTGIAATSIKWVATYSMNENRD